MKKTLPRSRTARPPRPAPRRPRWRWPLAGALALTAAAAAFALLHTANEPWPAKAPEVPEVWVPGGEFLMGDDEFADAPPVHKVAVDGFWMDRTEVTNEQFAWFVKQTGYRTVAERQRGRSVEPAGSLQCRPRRGMIQACRSPSR